MISLGAFMIYSLTGTANIPAPTINILRTPWNALKITKSATLRPNWCLNRECMCWISGPGEVDLPFPWHNGQTSRSPA